MKQRITIEQLKELTPEQQERLREIVILKVGDAISLHPTGIIPPYEYLVQSDTACVSVNFNDILKKLTMTRYNECDYLPLLSIGQMIELLESHANGGKVDIGKIFNPKGWEIYFDIWVPGKGAKFTEGIGEELADALWKAVKEIL